MLYCGFSEFDITPELGMDVPGYFNVRKNTGVLEPLFAKAAVFEADGVCAAVVVCDAIFLDRSDVVDIRCKAQELCGIAPENVFVWATHTHTGGPVSNIFRTRRDRKYIRNMTDSAARAVAEAFENRRPAKLGSATGEVDGIAFIRRFFMKDGTVKTNPGQSPDRVRPEGTEDKTYTLIRVEDAENGKVMGFLSSFGLHLDTVSGEMISADYPGILATLVRGKYGEDVKSVFFTGPCGNVNHFNHSGESTKGENRVRIANALFAKLSELDAKITCRDAGISVKNSRFLVRLREESRENIAWARGVLDGSIDAEDGLMMDNTLMAKAIISVAERIEEATEVEIGVMKIGGCSIIEWPGEIFVEFGRQVRRAMPGEDVIIGELGGGSMWCYIPTEAAFEHGGYEPHSSGPLCGRTDLGERIASETLKMINA